MTARRREWVGAVSLGVWLSIAAVWPVSTVQIGKNPILWQPMLLVSLLVLTLLRARKVGMGPAAGQSLYCAVILSLAGWLPWLRSVPSTPEFSYPNGYRYYLILYEAAVASLVGFQAFCAASERARRWWPAGQWSRPLVVAPVLLLLRSISFGQWVNPLIGVVIGLLVAAVRPWRRLALNRWGKCVPWVLLGGAVLAVIGSGIRIYLQLGSDFPLDSDDGISYFASAKELAADPRRIWTPPPIESNMFSLYVVLMGLWFRVVGAHIPSWLVWQGLAAGLLAVMVYRLGQRVGGRPVGLVAAALVMLDHVMLHLMATLNMEVGFVPALYVAVWLWISVPDQPPRAQVRRCLFAGLMMGVATLFRPTSALLLLALGGVLFWERPKLSWRELSKQAGWMFAGFAVPIGLLLIRHRMAWGHWTFSGSGGAPLSWNANYAWDIQGQHPYRIGWGPWLTLLTSDPSVIWRKMVPDWWAQILFLWTHRGFGQMDLIQGLNYPGFYQATLAMIFTASVVVGMAQALRRRTRADVVLLVLPAYFTSLAFVFWVINTRYRAPFIPALYLFCCAGCSAIAAATRFRATEPRIIASSERATSAVLPGRLASVP